ncbi:CaiB/BaiF CoA transferase family protein [Aestuariivirga sp.]|uniref:CaiB/BaiF CoA transferase family protein n=1 Tax=Aestuariivirga sp. TaxID=2650926 RepID=UPI0035931C23
MCKGAIILNAQTGTARKSGALEGLRVLDLSRILAGPTATQLLADMGADVIKIERPGAGDDTRGWGPPFLETRPDAMIQESAYFLSANRGKSSLAVDISVLRGQDIIRRLAEDSDVLVENFKLGDLERYGLDYGALRKINSRLIYCSISGFGRSGPNAHRAGYDFLVQAEGGLMSLTGNAESAPMKAGVGVADFVCGLFASNAILAALQARHRTGEGQHIDLALIDCQMAMLVNQGVGYLTDGKVPPRRGNDHPTIVPYGVFPAADQDIILAIGNDQQFRRFVTEAGAAHLADSPDYARNKDRVLNRDRLIPQIAALTQQRPAEVWLLRLEELGVPAGPVNDLKQVFEGAQAQAREMCIALPHKTAHNGKVALIGNPIKYSETPVQYHKGPPLLGEDSKTILAERLGLSEAEILDLVKEGIVGTA